MMTNYTELVKALRCMELRLSCNECEYGVWSESGEAWGCEFERKNDDAAAAIEALQAEVKRLEPKRGKWIEETSGYNWYGKCSVCGKEMCVDAYYADMKFCPNCGAKMEVQE